MVVTDHRSLTSASSALFAAGHLDKGISGRTPPRSPMHRNRGRIHPLLGGDARRPAVASAVGRKRSGIS
jgi:hypothetical protein